MHCVFLAFVVTQAPPKDIEELFIKYRAALTSGRMTIVGETHFPAIGVNGTKWTKKVWYDRDHFRCDHVSLLPPTGRTVYCENCERENHYAYFEERSLDPKYEQRIIPLRLQTMSLPPGTSRVGETEHKFEPRALGTFTGSFYHFHGVKLGALARTDRGPLSWERTTWKGKDAWVMSFRLKHGPLKRVTFVPELANSLVKAELWDGTLHETMESEPRQFGGQRTWFPSKLVGRRVEGGEVIETYTLNIIDAEFNEPIPPETFKLVGLNVPARTAMTVHTPGDEGTYYWDGKRIAPVQRISKAKDPDRTPEDSASGKKGMSTLSISLAVLGVVTISAYFYRAKFTGKR